MFGGYSKEMCRSHVFRMWKRHSDPKWRARFRRVFYVQLAWERGLKGSTGGEDGFYPWRVDYAVASRLANVVPFLILYGGSIIHGVPWEIAEFNASTVTNTRSRLKNSNVHFDITKIIDKSTWCCNNIHFRC